MPGTTRDVVDTQLVVRGMPVWVLDTAGIRETVERVEQLGIERSRQAMQRADVVLLVMEAQRGWTPEDQELYDEISQPCIVLVNKTDLAPVPPLAEDITAIPFSARLNQGVPELEAALWEKVSGGLTSSSLEVAVNQRQKAALLEVQSSLAQLTQTQTQRLPLDFWSIDLRAAVGALSRITGDEVNEEMLDLIFSRFCIGK
jgi:tRNA modification GTPase